MRAEARLCNTLKARMKGCVLPWVTRESQEGYELERSSVSSGYGHTHLGCMESEMEAKNLARRLG